jgi:hypothetical protein
MVLEYLCRVDTNHPKKNASNGLESRFTSIACKNMNYEFLFQAVRKIAIRRIFD